MLVVVVAYCPSLTTSFLNWDDPWLVSQNKLVRLGLSALPRILFDLRGSTRFELGAEYLPVRDLSWCLDFQIHGLAPRCLRIGNLAIYLGFLLVLRRYLVQILGATISAEIAIWLFALHPAHVEVVAWITSRKDLLALLFSAMSMQAYVRSAPKPLVVIALVTLAVFSKSAMTVLPLLLMLNDYLLRRAPRLSALIPSAVVCAAAALIHILVGRNVGMMQSPAGGTHGTAVINAARVLLSYITTSVFPWSLALIRDPPVLLTWDQSALAGVGLLLGMMAIGVTAHLRDRRLSVFCFFWFLIPLAPVAGILFSLQNRQADRYLALSLLGPCLVASAAVTRLPRPFPLALVGAGLTACMALTMYRAWLFGESERVMSESFVHSPDSRRAALMLGNALEERGSSKQAIAAYLAAFRRSSGSDDAAIRGALAAGRLEKVAGNVTAARSILEAAAATFPRDQRVIRKLAEARMAEASTH